jgi:hypothetical protein
LQALFGVATRVSKNYSGGQNESKNCNRVTKAYGVLETGRVTFIGL